MRSGNTGQAPLKPWTDAGICLQLPCAPPTIFPSPYSYLVTQHCGGGDGGGASGGGDGDADGGGDGFDDGGGDGDGDGGGGRGGAAATAAAAAASTD